MQMVITKVKLKPGTTEACASLFEMTNPDIVRGEPDWLGARMVVDQKTEAITVMALWRTAKSYHTMTASSSFQNVMREFGQFFASPPEITVTDVLVDMTPDSLSRT